MTSPKTLTVLNPTTLFSISAEAVEKGMSWTYPPDDEGKMPKEIGHGFTDLKPNDLFSTEIEVYSDQTLILTGTPASMAAKAVWANTSGSNSSYAYFVHSLLQNRTMSDRYGASLTSGFYQWLSNFRTNFFDVSQDNACGLGDVGVVSIKKIKFGENIKPLSVTISTSAGGAGDPSRTFRDTCSGDDTWGILCDKNGSSAGIIFYDIGVAIIHGPSATAAKACSAVTAVTLQSTYKIWQLNAFCTMGTDDFRQPSNPTAFYKRAVTGDPMFNPSLTAFDAYGYQPGDKDVVLSGTRGNYLLDRLGSGWGPYITTVGLYNDNNEMVAVAKLSQPIRKPQYYPLTVRVALDFD